MLPYIYMRYVSCVAVRRKAPCLLAGWLVAGIYMLPGTVLSEYVLVL